MQSRLIFTYNSDQTLDTVELTPLFQNSVGTPQYFLRAFGSLRTDNAAIIFERSDGETAHAPMNRNPNGSGWVYTSNGWETMLAGELKINFRITRPSQLSPEVLATPEIVTQQVPVNVNATGYSPLTVLKPESADLILAVAQQALDTAEAAAALHAKELYNHYIRFVGVGDTAAVCILTLNSPEPLTSLYDFNRLLLERGHRNVQTALPATGWIGQGEPEQPFNKFGLIVGLYCDDGSLWAGEIRALRIATVVSNADIGNPSDLDFAFDHVVKIL